MMVNEFPCHGLPLCIPVALGAFISLPLLVVVAVLYHSGRLGGWPTTNDTVSQCWLELQGAENTIITLYNNFYNDLYCLQIFLIFNQKFAMARLGVNSSAVRSMPCLSMGLCINCLVQS